MENPFVTTEWLAAQLGDPDVIPVDASWYLPSSGREPHAEYLAGHIPGAVYFGIDEIADHSNPLPHMLLRPEQFAAVVGALGIGDGMTIVVYDEAGLFSAPRVWWELQAMGASDVRILSGGGAKWRAEGRPLATGESNRRPVVFTPAFRPELVRNLEQMKAAVAAGRQIADARPGGRFAGREPEPRAGLRSGHMPGAVSVPAGSLVAGGQLKPVDELKALFAGIDLAQPVITSCGSGVTASTLLLALKLAGARDVAVYDGSWAEWGSQPDTPVVTD